MAVSRRRIVLVALGIVALLLASTLFVLSREATLRWGAQKLEARSGGALSIDQVSGSLLSRIHAREIRWRSPSLEVTASEATLDWSPLWLFTWTLAFDRIEARSVAVVRHATGDPSRTGMPTSLRLPMGVRLRAANVKDVSLQNPGGGVVAFQNLAFGVEFGRGGWAGTLDNVRSKWGVLRGRVDVAAEPPFATRGGFTLDPKERADGVPPIAVEATAQGDLNALGLAMTVRAESSTAEGKATLALFAAQPVKSLAIDLRGVDPRHLVTGAPEARVDGSLAATTDADGSLRGRFKFANAVPGRINEARVPVRMLTGELVAAIGRWWLEDTMIDLGPAGTLQGTAWVSASEAGTIFTTAGLNLQAVHASLVSTRLRGTLATTGPFTRQQVQVALADPRVGVNLDGVVSPAGVEIRRALATASGSRFDGKGTLAFAAGRAFSLNVAMTNFDPARFGRYPAAVVNGKVVARGVLQPALQVHAEATLAPSTLFGLPASGRALVNSRGTDNAAIALDANAKLGATLIAARGTLVDPSDLKSLDMTLSVSGPDLSEVYAITRLPFPATAEYKLDGRLAYADSTWSFRNFKGSVGRSDLAGDIAVNVAGARPRLKATLTSQRLDLRDMGGFVGANPHGDADSDRVLAQSSFKLDKLNAADADVHFTGRSFRNPRLPLHAMNARLVLDNGQLTLDPLDFRAAGGDISAQVHLDARRSPIVSSADVQVRALAVNRLVPGVKAVMESAGTLDGRTQLAMRGDSVAAMLGSANGEMKFAVSGGAISDLILRLANLDIANSLIAMARGNPTIPVRCFVADIAARDGVLEPRTLVLDTEHTLVSGEGTVNLRDESLEVSLFAQPKGGSLLALRGPIRINGTLADPAVHPDLGNAIARAGAAIALGAVAGPLALLPLMQKGKDVSVDCEPLILDASRFIHADSARRAARAAAGPRERRAARSP